MKSYDIAVLSGDGIGVEVINEALKVLDSIPKNFQLNFKHYLVGGAGYDNFGNPLPKATLDGCKNSDAILFGSIGGEKWESLPKELRPESGLLRLRKELGIYANIRPVKAYSALLDSSPLKIDRVENVDLVIIRELIGGIYFGEPRGRKQDIAFDTMVYSKDEIKRIAKYAFEMARKRNKKVCCVDKANVLETSLLWREVVNEVASGYSDIDLSFMYVDNASMQLIINPRQFDVILTENLFGDILSDEASVIGGSIGLLASASIGDKYALFEPCHGSAPDIAGQNIANPLATIISASMMLEFLGEVESAKMIIKAIDLVLCKGYRTKDLDKNNFILCSSMGDEVVSCIKEIANG